MTHLNLSLHVHTIDSILVCIEVFAGQEYVSLASLSVNVPILSCGGISKRHMVPGWRLGWVIIHDRNHTFQDQIRPGLSNLAMKLMGPCTLVQAALPHMLKNTPQEFHDRNMANARKSAEIVFKGLKGVSGLVPLMPAGSMYMMVRCVPLRELIVMRSPGGTGGTPGEYVASMYSCQS